MSTKSPRKVRRKEHHHAFSVRDQWEILKLVQVLQREHDHINWGGLAFGEERRRRLLQREPNRKRWHLQKPRTITQDESSSQQEEVAPTSANKARQRRKRKPRPRPSPPQQSSSRQDNNNDFVDIPIYQYDQGNCPDSGSTGLPCAANSRLSDICSPYSETGRLSECILACAPSICCIHDTPPEENPFAPTCRTDENCPQYTPCYSAFWSMVDHVGPATEFQFQNGVGDFYDVDSLQDTIDDPLFFQQLLFHHFDDIRPILELLANADSIQEVFAMPEIWNATSAISGNGPPEKELSMTNSGNNLTLAQSLVQNLPESLGNSDEDEKPIIPMNTAAEDDDNILMKGDNVTIGVVQAIVANDTVNVLPANQSTAGEAISQTSSSTNSIDSSTVVANIEGGLQNTITVSGEQDRANHSTFNNMTNDAPEEAPSSQQQNETMVNVDAANDTTPTKQGTSNNQSLVTNTAVKEEAPSQHQQNTTLASTGSNATIAIVDAHDSMMEVAKANTTIQDESEKAASSFQQQHNMSLRSATERRDKTSAIDGSDLP